MIANPASLRAIFMLPFVFSLLVSSSAAATERPVTLSGMVANADATPVPGALVVVAEGPPVLRFMQRMARQTAPKALKALGTASVDDEGKFTIALPHEAPEFGWRRTRLTVWAYHPAAAMSVRLMDRDWPRAGLPLSLTLGRAGPARLKITNADGQPITGARVRPQCVAGQPMPDMIAQQMIAVTDDDGIVIARGPAASDLDAVVVDKESFGTQWIGLPRLTGNKPTTIALAPVGQLTGRLMADDPRAIRQRKLRFATWLEPGDETAGGGLAEVVTNDDGTFEIPAIAAGSLTFEVDETLSRLSLRESASFRGVKGDDEPVYLAAQTTGPQIDPGKTTKFEIPLRRAVLVTQEVRDRDDGSPIAGVRVSLRWGIPGGASGHTDAAGRFTTHLLPGTVTAMPVRIPRPYYYPKATYAGQAVAEGAEHLALSVLQLARGVEVRGRVVDGGQRPVAGAEVVGFWPLPAGGDTPVRAWSNAAGEFIINGVAPGADVRLWASHGQATNFEPVTARPQGMPVEIVIGAKPSISLEGRVLEASGKPIAGAAVRVWGEQHQDATGFESIPLGSLSFDGNDRLTTDADGFFHTPRSLRPNVEYSLDVEAPGMLRIETEAIEPGTWKTTRFADIVLHAAPRLRTVLGQVVDHDGRPVADARVWQSGDGTSRTETTTDVTGRFQLQGVFDEPALVFVRKEAFRLQGARVPPATKECRVILKRANEPAPPRTALPPNLPLREGRKLGMSLIAPLLPMIHDPVFESKHVQLLNIIAEGDPEQALEISEKVLTNPRFITQARRVAALSIIETDLDEGVAILTTLEKPFDRALAYLNAWDALTEVPHERRDGLLHEALVQTRVENDVGNKVYLMGRIADRWLDLGQRERATALVREGQVLAEQLPSPSEATQRDTAVHMRGRFAGALARIDGPAALALIEGFEEPHRDWYRANLARGLAEHDPAEAERLFHLIEFDNLRFTYGLAVVHRMATTDVQRAARLAESYAEAGQQAYALGIVAHGAATADRATAASFLLQAYERLERALELGQIESDTDASAVKAAALLPVAEKIAPEQLEELLWRALAMRPPRAAQGDKNWKRERLTAALATLVARYDRDLARDLLKPLSHRLREAAAEAESSPWHAARPLLMALAATDARWAAQLVQALPDYQVEAAKNTKQIAARLLAEWLVSSPHDFWSTVYSYTGLRDPEASDEVP